MPSARRQSDAPPRVRDPELHRQAILDAATRVFAERGYTHATVREIAGRAGVTHGLVLRHFGTKESLFLAAVPGPRDLVELVAGPREGLSRRIAEAFVRRMEAQDGTDPFVALVRSAGSGTKSAAQLYTSMEQEAVRSYRRLLGDSVVAHRVPFLAALLVGVTLGRYVIRAGALADMSTERFTDDLTSSIEVLLDTADGETGADDGIEAGAEGQDGKGNGA